MFHFPTIICLVLAKASIENMVGLESPDFILCYCTAMKASVSVSNLIQF